MTRAEYEQKQCNYAAEVRLRRNPCGECASCRLPREAEIANRIGESFERRPFVSTGEQLNSCKPFGPMRLPKPAKRTLIVSNHSDFVAAMQSTDNTQFSSVMFEPTAEHKAEQEAYIAFHKLPF